MSLTNIPRPSTAIEPALRRVLDPIIDAVQRRLVGQVERPGEKAVTRDELVALGVITSAQANELEG